MECNPHVPKPGEKIDAETLEDSIWKGATIQLEDNGALYDEFYNPIAQRGSSHKHDENKKPYYIVGTGLDAKSQPFTIHVLVWGWQNATFFQLEKWAWSFPEFKLQNLLSFAKQLIKTPHQPVTHTLSYVRYKKSSKNQGPLGQTPYTDRNPIICTPASHKRAKTLSQPLCQLLTSSSDKLPLSGPPEQESPHKV